MTDDLACRCESDTVVHFHGQLPIFSHRREDVASFRMFTAQLIVCGSATQGDIQRAFGVLLVSIKYSTKLYRERGATGCFAPTKRHDGTKLTPAKLAQARALLEAGEPRAQVWRAALMS